MANSATQFREWLDSVCTDTSAWRQTEVIESEHPYFSNADKKDRKVQGYIHDYMMDNYDWYADSIAHYRDIMAMDEADLGLDPEPLTLDQEGFWEQFNGKS